METKNISLKPLNDFAIIASQMSGEMHEFMSWANYLGSGSTSNPIHMTKKKINDLNRTLQQLRNLIPDVKRTLREIRDSGHFDRKNYSTQLHFFRKDIANGR